ncbi:MAG: hypothetical protein J6P72_05710 [Firmicutes bacterium]|nr:hypothetical protein [Bacillota bacterium]
MRLWMYGCADEKQPSETIGASKLRKIGFEALVGGKKCVEAARENGLDAYAACGAYRGPDFRDDSWLAQDVHGRRQRWFSSTCPTRKEVRAYNLSVVKEIAGWKGIKGVIIDGARFASPSSGEIKDGIADPDAFFTCFCPACMNKARKMGFDPVAMQKAAAGLYDYLHGMPVRIERHMEGLYEWMEFRRLSTTEHLLDFAKTVKSVNPDLKTGIFIFTPSLNKLVGQHYRDLAGAMDIFSPMIYRCYKEISGPACLNVELADLLAMLQGAKDLTDSDRIRVLSGLTGLVLSDGEDTASIRKGLDIEVLREETSRSRVQTPGAVLAPIIEFDDPQLEEALNKTLEGGADAVNFFAYQDDILEAQAQLLQKAAFS